MDSSVKLIMGVIIAPECDKTQLIKIISKEFGAVDTKSEPEPFDYTDYYTPEMGESLERQWLSFEKLISPGELSRIKNDTIKIENSLKRKDGTRIVNLDPGYITLHNLVLASTKNYSHRIYLDNGIYGELTLIYSNKEFHPLDWTYPDYKENKRFFEEVRAKLKNTKTTG